jgi:DNA polymerase-3 subunit beta
MKFRCDRDRLLDALGTVARVAARGGSFAVPGLRLAVSGGALEVTGTDRDVTIEATVEVAGMRDGVVVAPSRLVLDVVRSLEPGAVVFEASGEELAILAGRSQFSLRTYAESDFPETRAAVGELATVPAASFAEALRQVVRAASSDDARPILTGVLIAARDDGLRLVATDSYRLAVRDVGGSTFLSPGQQVLVPARALAEVQRLLGAGMPVEGSRQGDHEGRLGVRLGEFDVRFELGSVRLTTRLLDQAYPDYEQLIPQGYPNRLVAGRQAMLEATRRVRVLAREATTAVRLAMRPESVTLSVVSEDTGHASEDVDAKYEGAELMLAFNPAYLIDGLEALTGDEIVLEALEVGKPAVMREVEGSEYRYLLMPVRIASA